jgi:membrane fusion protein, copper/silver efflux system
MKRPIHKFPIYTALLLAGFVAGYFVFSSSGHGGKGKIPDTVATDEEIWTCAMHPQIRMHEKGKCPICGMELVPARNGLDGSQAGIDATALETAALSGISTSKVSAVVPSKKISLFGKAEYDERSVQSQIAYFPGRIEKLYINFTGETITKGQPLALIYSPELINAQQELLTAWESRAGQPELYQAAREKLIQWRINESTIDQIVRSGDVIKNFTVSATTTGTVTSRNVSEGQYVTAGTVLLGVTDLSRMWIIFDAYENDLGNLSKGNKVTFTARAIPDRSYSGIINFIDPVIDPETRIARVRVELPVNDGSIKPGMFVSGTVEAGMKKYSGGLVVPKSAVLWTGKRSIVYVKNADSGKPEFHLREVVLGASLGDSYLIESGLKEGEEVVTRGAFSIDAAAQLEGKPSMMNSAAEETETIASEFKVAGSCELCKDRVEKAANSVDGVISAKWDVNSQLMKVTFRKDKADKSVIEKAVANAGHDTELFRADDVTYQALPECCHYRK